MAFIKAAWKIVVAVKDGLVLLLLLLFFGLLFAILAAAPDVGAVRNGALLVELDGVIVEEAAPIDPLDGLLTGGTAVPEYSARDLIHAINSGTGDDRVTALVLDLDFFLGGGQVSLGDVGQAIERFKKTGKPVYAFATFYTDDSYRLAAHADEVWLDPMGGIAIAGPGGSQLYYKRLIDKLGVTANIYRVGTYKSAVEPYMLSGPSSASSEARRDLYGSLWERWQSDVAKVRPKAKLADYVQRPADLAEQAEGDLARMALDAGLADKIGDRISFERHVATKVGDAPDDDETLLFAASRYPDWLAANPRGEDGNAIAIVTIAGEIVDGGASPGMAASSAVTDLIYGGLNDESFKALVVRIDSPGGSALASEEIRLALKEVRDRDIPVVVSMGDVAASGGYWIATESDAIFAEPDTITGSIGVFAVLPSFEKLLNEWGVDSAGGGTTPLSGQPDFTAGFNDEFDRIAQAGVENSYAKFISLVSKARKLSPERVDEIGQGRVWDGGTAHQLKLVDRLGGFDEALAEAAKRAKLSDYHPLFLKSDDEWPVWLFSDDSISVLSQKRERHRGWIAQAAWRQRATMGAVLRTAERLIGGSDVQALCLECGRTPSAKDTARAKALLPRLEGLLPAAN